MRKADNQVGLAVIARRWVVERFFAWINRNRRLAKDFEASIESVEAFLYAASSVVISAPSTAAGSAAQHAEARAVWVVERHGSAGFGQREAKVKLWVVGQQSARGHRRPGRAAAPHHHPRGIVRLTA